MKDMSEITIPKTTITDAQHSYNARQLYMTVIYRAVEDYCKTHCESTRKAILKDLRSARMTSLTDGMSELVAGQLEIDSDAIAERLKVFNKDMNYV